MKVCNARRVLVSHKGKQSNVTFVMNSLWVRAGYDRRLLARTVKNFILDIRRVPNSTVRLRSHKLILLP